MRWQCARCEREYHHNPSTCRDCGHTILDLQDEHIDREIWRHRLRGYARLLAGLLGIGLFLFGAYHTYGYLDAAQRLALVGGHEVTTAQALFYYADGYIIAMVAGAIIALVALR